MPVSANQKYHLRDSLIHMFESNGSRFLFEAPTSIALQLDNIAYDLVNSLRTNSVTKTKDTLLKSYPPTAVESVFEEFETLKKSGLFSFCKYQKLEFKLEQLSSYRPSQLVLMVAQRCNLQCKYCYGKAGKYGERDSLMSEDTALKAVDLVVDNSLDQKCRLTFFGGEPLLNFPLIVETVRYAKTRGREKGKAFTFGITTNGTLLTPEIIEFLKKEKFNLLLSFDGPRDIHDSMRIYKNGLGSFHDVYRNAKRLEHAGLKFAVRATLTSRCVSLERLSDFFVDEVCPRVHIHPVSPANSSDSCEAFQLNRQDYGILLKEYERIAHNLIRRYREGKQVAFNPFRTWLDLIDVNARKFHACGVCRGMSAVGTDGLIYPCHRFVGMKNYITGDLECNIDMKKVYEIFTRYYSDREICNTCWARYLCAGGCMHTWANSDGSFIKQENEECRLTKGLIELSILLYASLPGKPWNGKHQSVGLQEKSK